MSAPAQVVTTPDAARRRPALVRLAWLLAGCGLLVLLLIASVAFGNRILSLDELLAGLGGSTDGVGPAAVVARLPRTVLAALVGAALAVAGTAFQAVTRNPLADPGIMGITAGASLAVVCGIAFIGVTAPYPMMAFAVVGAGAAAVFVYAVGSLGRGGATPLKLALAGAATTAACMALVSAILLPRVDLLETFRFWQVGSVGGATWNRILIVAPVLGAGALIVVATARGMNTLALGDELATGLGEHVARTRMIATVGAVVLCGAATAIAGPIAFVGLVVPHLCRLLVGTDHRWLVPASAIVGAALVVAADTLGRVVDRPDEVEVAIVTAVLGAPLFIAIVRRQKVREL